MQSAESYVNERLDHLGIVEGVCEEIEPMIVWAGHWTGYTRTIPRSSLQASRRKHESSLV